MELRRNKIIVGAFILMLVILFLILKYGNFNTQEFSKATEYSKIETNEESCLNCHNQTQGFSKYHNPELIGCISCHLGNGGERDKDKSHEGMILIPGNLSDAAETCGKCHPNELSRIENSLMTTNSGIVAVDKFIFGEADSLNYHYHIKNIKHTASEKHLRDLCANCHLGAEKKKFGEINQLSRGGGCNACHLNYSDKAVADLEKYFKSDKKELPKMHPSTDIFVKDKHCFGCHSRSSRISTNYEGWHETLLDKDDIKGEAGYRVLEDLRVYTKKTEDVHHAKGMLCIDCHSSHEVMGDGDLYAHEEQAVKLQCSDCHFKENPETTTYDELDMESQLVFLHREYSHHDKEILVAEKDKHPLVNTYLDSSNVYLISKNDGALHDIKPQSDVCSRDNVHKNVSCATCHSSWTPRCIGCHNVFDKNDPTGYDLLDKKQVKGQWIEHVSEFSSSLPAMGVRENDEGRHIEPAIPGMIMTIDKGSFNGKKNGEEVSFHRLYAPNSPHTTTKAVRDCKSCHANPATLGYGNGELVYTTKKGLGKWEFTPEYALNKNDNLPEDAWVGFLNSKNQNKVNSTRDDFRPFTVKEQQQILLVGACLQCHKEDSKIMKQTLMQGIDKVLLKISKECILPTY